MGYYNQQPQTTEALVAGKGEDAFRFIVLLHTKRILELMSKDLTGGFWMDRPVHLGASIHYMKTYMPCGYDATCNAIMGLNIILSPKYDQKMKKAREAFDTLYDQLKSEYRKHGVKPEADVKQKYKNDRFDLHLELYEAIMSYLSRFNYLEAEQYEESDLE